MPPLLRSLPPIVDERARVLILGSMPGRQALEERRYYANPQNHFWRVIHRVFGAEPGPSYEERVAFVQDKGIAMWDTLRECTRVGSLDRTIGDEVPNNINGLLSRYPDIRCVFFNGAKSYRSFTKLVYLDPEVRRRLSLFPLPSTSPLNAHLSIEEKVSRWREVRRCLEQGSLADGRSS